ncbi:hypothetical protein [Pseudogemmobacter sonorensis]|uniref:hypothetical protein n=1 Tax=Pseudogemmobacter sonorensis TaxID=2989681 RepID=UPI0036A980FB
MFRVPVSRDAHAIGKSPSPSAWGPAVRRGLRRAVLAACVVLPLGAPPAPAFVVRHDLGGGVEERIRSVERLRAQGTRIRIEGICISACTLYLGLPQTCVSPSARLGFHGPSSSLPGLPLPRSEFERVSQTMASYYPAAMRRWFMSEARMITRDYYLISGHDAIALGAKSCD